MKIVSRPHEEDQTVAVGNGNIMLLVTPEQLELIAAVVYGCRLGSGTIYSAAAYELIDQIEQSFGSDFMGDAYDDVDLQITVEDTQGAVLFTTATGVHTVTLEV
jgi:hypothetical protein